MRSHSTGPSAPRRRLPVVPALVVAALLTSGASAADGGGGSTYEVGSGARFRTTVTSATEGTLDDKDLHQASLLASQLLSHLNHAIARFNDGKEKEAAEEIARGLTLTEIVKKLLPVRVITTRVTGADGKEAYSYVERVQNSRIPIHEGMIALEVVEPILESKAKEAELKGLRLSDAEVYRTSVLADVDYLERKLRRAQSLTATPDKALAELVLAQTRGVDFSVDRSDDPLVKAQHALHLAETMAREGRYDAAMDNLRLAKVHLETYRALMGGSADEKVAKLQEGISGMIRDIQTEGVLDRIREAWEKTVSWWTRKPGQAVTTGPAADAGKAGR